MIESPHTHEKKYRTVRVPEALVESILGIINDTENSLGYRSHSEFIIDAVRRRVEVLSSLSVE